MMERLPLTSTTRAGSDAATLRRRRVKTDPSERPTFALPGAVMAVALLCQSSRKVLDQTGDMAGLGSRMLWLAATCAGAATGPTSVAPGIAGHIHAPPRTRDPSCSRHSVATRQRLFSGSARALILPPSLAGVPDLNLLAVESCVSSWPRASAASDIQACSSCVR